MIFNNNKYETLVPKRLVYILQFWICSHLSQTEMFSILCNPVIVSAV